MSKLMHTGCKVIALRRKPLSGRPGRQVPAFSVRPIMYSVVRHKFGAGSGIGAAATILFATEGADVAIVDKNEKDLDEVAAKVAGLGKKPCIIYADVSKDDNAKRIIADTINTFGKLDVLVNNAAFGSLGCILDGKALKAYDDVMSVNVRAVIHLTTLAAPYLAATKGNIVNISSIAGTHVPSAPSVIAYSVSKAALDHFTRGAALELASTGVRVNSVNPGLVNTEFMKKSGLKTNLHEYKLLAPLKRMSEPEEIADLILYLAGEKARAKPGLWGNRIDMEGNWKNRIQCGMNAELLKFVTYLYLDEFKIENHLSSRT
ncbi:enoyl-(Acyl carrier protein) reductase domain-containing protein [Phthorimaea operculella]|nr:enoyl-(Acyl carrier protein) reductase domain-containing protein [Phthorimaea operculella]